MCMARKKKDESCSISNVIKEKLKDKALSSDDDTIEFCHQVVGDEFYNTCSQLIADGVKRYLLKEVGESQKGHVKNLYAKYMKDSKVFSGEDWSLIHNLVINAVDNMTDSNALELLLGEKIYEASRSDN